MGDITNSGVGEFMCSLYKNQEFTDVTFVTKTEKNSRSGHRVVIAAQSPYFQELLFGKQKKKVFGTEMKVIISNIEFDVFCNILDYLYTGQIDFTDDSTVMDIYAGAKELRVISLIKRCESYFEELALTADNVCYVFEMSDKKDIEFLKDNCIEFIQKNTSKVITSTSFEKCHYPTIHMICNLKYLQLNSESVLLDAVLRWTNAQPDHTKPLIMEPLFSCIQFLTLTNKELGNSIQKHPNLIKAEDALKLMMFLNGSGDYETLPSWCNKNVNPRCSGQMPQEVNGPRLEDEEYSTKEIVVPLEKTDKSENISNFFSHLHLTCIRGSHQIEALAFVLEALPLNGTVVILNLSMQLDGSGFRYHKRMLLHNTEKELYFSRPLYVKEGDKMRIKLETEAHPNCKFFRLTEENFAVNEDFVCSVKTERNLFCISKIQYSSQSIPKRFRKNQQSRSKSWRFRRSKSQQSLLDVSENL